MKIYKGKVALITGGTGKLGRAIALKLGDRAGRIGIHYFHQRQEALATIKKIEEQGTEGFAFKADLASPEGAKKLMRMVEEKWGRVDILVNNFGPFLERAWEETSAEDWLYLFQTNVLASFELMKAVIPGMKARKWGRIINIGFHRAEQIVAFPNIMPYAAAKTSVLILTRTAASTLSRYGITVNMVSPGLIEEGRLPRQVSSSSSAAGMGRAEDVAEAVSFLASEEASAISGTNLIVAGTWKL
jgi:3-oxoacyl-[acyl-carrier protein] reductase